MIEATVSAIGGGGCLCFGDEKSLGLCRFHTVNIPLMVVMSKHGFNVAERDLAADIKDRIHAMFRSCETVVELVWTHQRLCIHIKTDAVPKGPSRARRHTNRHSGGSLKARRDSSEATTVATAQGPAPKRPKGTKKGGAASRAKYEVERFVRKFTTAGGLDYIEVKWASFTDTTAEPPSRLSQDLV